MAPYINPHQIITCTIADLSFLLINVTLAYSWHEPTRLSSHDDVMKWKHFPPYWPFVRGIHRSPVNYPHKGQWRGALMFSLIRTWTNDWITNRDDGDLRRNHTHYDVMVMSDYWWLGASSGVRGRVASQCECKGAPAWVSTKPSAAILLTRIWLLCPMKHFGQRIYRMQKIHLINPTIHNQISHNAVFYNRNGHTWTFLLQNGALWDIGLVHCGIGVTGLLVILL